ncbi:retrovirus-related pol polyprotein from transposon TNT 1-94 [Tanacetum coccineum]
MAFISTSLTSRYLQTNNQLRTSSNPSNQATIQDGQCTQSKTTQNSDWFKEKMLLAQAQEARVILDEEQIAFLVDIWERVDSGPIVQALTTTAIFQTNDLNAFDLYCDEAPKTSAIFMANLTSYDSNVLFKVPNYDTYQDNNVIDQSVQEMQYFEQPVFINNLNIDITSDSNVIYYDQYMNENKSEVVQGTTSSEQQDAMIMSVIDEIGSALAEKLDAISMIDTEETLRKNREAHIDYLNITKEHDDTLCGIVEQARALKPLDNMLDYACNEKMVVVTPMKKNRQVSFVEFSNTSANTTKDVDAYNNQNTNRHLLPLTGVKSSTNASGSQPMSNTRNNRISRPSSSNMKDKRVEVHPRNVKSSLNKINRVSVCDANIKHGVLNTNSDFVCSTCNECLFSANHDMCAIDYLNDVNARAKAKSVKSIKNNEWKPTAIMGYGDYQIGNVTISMVYYVAGLRHNLFLVGQLCDSDLEVAFRKHSCFVHGLEGVDLLKGSRGTDLYTISLEDMLKSSPICLLSKASKTKSWLWHRCLSHLNFGTINHLAKEALVRGGYVSRRAAGWSGCAVGSTLSDLVKTGWSGLAAGFIFAHIFGQNDPKKETHGWNEL